MHPTRTHSSGDVDVDVEVGDVVDVDDDVDDGECGVTPSPSTKRGAE